MNQSRKEVDRFSGILRVLVRSWFLLTLLLVHLALSDEHTDIIYGFRWGGNADDKVLIENSQRIADGEYQLTHENVRRAVTYDASKGWRKSSGSGIYFSEDPVDSFSDGRSELFIFKLLSPKNVAFPIGIGGLGDLVRSYYLENGPTPPIVSQYTNTWYVIARPPYANEKGLNITFHRASERDVPVVLNELKSKWPAASLPGNFERIFAKIDQRINIEKLPVPPETLRFLKSFVDQSRSAFPLIFTESEALESLRNKLISSLSGNTDLNCSELLLKASVERNLGRSR